jgi:hypothetical protein
VDFKKFGSVLIFIGLIALAISAYCYYTAHEMRFDIAEAIRQKIMGSSSGAMRLIDLEIKEESLKQRGFYFGIAGGLFSLLGIGLKISAKPSNPKTVKADAQTPAIE